MSKRIGLSEKDEMVACQWKRLLSLGSVTLKLGFSVLRSSVSSSLMRSMASWLGFYWVWVVSIIM